MCSQKEEESPYSSPKIGATTNEDRHKWVEVEGNKPNPNWHGNKHVPTHNEAVTEAVKVARRHLQLA